MGDSPINRMSDRNKLLNNITSHTLYHVINTSYNGGVSPWGAHKIVSCFLILAHNNTFIVQLNLIITDHSAMNAEADMSLLPPLPQGTEADTGATIDYDTFPASKHSSSIHWMTLVSIIVAFSIFSSCGVVNRNIQPYFLPNRSRSTGGGLYCRRGTSWA